MAELGPGVTEVSVGDRVGVGYIQSCGVCRMCRLGYDGICLEGRRMGATQWGSHAEYVRLEARHCIPLPDALDFETAAASLICFPTAWHMTVTLGNVTAGQDVLVNAAGSGVGTSCVQVAKMHGARVIASAGSDEKLALAKNLGADALINYETQDLSEETHRVTDGKGADLVLESVGGQVYEKSIKPRPSTPPSSSAAATRARHRSSMSSSFSASSFICTAPTTHRVWRSNTRWDLSPRASSNPSSTPWRRSRTYKKSRV